MLDTLTVCGICAAWCWLMHATIEKEPVRSTGLDALPVVETPCVAAPVTFQWKKRVAR